MNRIASSSGGVAVVHDRRLLSYDENGARIAELSLDKPSDALSRFGEEWLLRSTKLKHLARVGSGGIVTTFAAGKKAIDAFGVGRDDAVAVTRGTSLELWSRDDQLRWSMKGGPFVRVVVARDYVVALGEDGALYFYAHEDGDGLGALRLASPEPVDRWRLTLASANIVVLALGEWLVWIDATTRKTIRRVRARAKVVEIASDAEHVVAAVEDGFVQAFRASTGEPRAAFELPDLDVAGLALGSGELFVLDAEGEVRTRDRRELDVTVRASSPIRSIAARFGLVAVGDRSGRVRVVAWEGGDLRELHAFSLGEPAGTTTGVVGLFVSRDEAIVSAGQRVVMRAEPPYQAPRPIALRAPPTAFAADDAYVFAGTQAGAVDVYDLAAGRHVTAYALSEDRITALARLSGATLVVGTGALDGRVLVVDVVEAKVVHRVSPHDEAFGVTCLASDARGRIVASGSDEGSVVLLDPSKGRVLAKLRVKETPTSLAFEPSGRRLACVFADGTAALVTFSQKAATVTDLGVRCVTHVAWGDGLVLGFEDGHTESGVRHAPPSERPAARP